MKQAIAPVGHARNDFDAFSELAERFELRDLFTEMRSEMEWVRYLYETAGEQAAKRGMRWDSFDEFWERGYFEMPAAVKPIVLFEKFRADPNHNRLSDSVGSDRDLFRTDCRFRL